MAWAVSAPAANRPSEAAEEVDLANQLADSASRAAAAWAEEEDLAAREGAWMAAVLLAGTNRPLLGVASRRLEDREEEEEEEEEVLVV